mmetsp:Transcript_15900/g.47132  ORF Transcript_15900/g.47132 Transcript_15900/m.47132 type:complete len:210 (-) Transcript_15900:1364-1993(-)
MWPAFSGLSSGSRKARRRESFQSVHASVDGHECSKTVMIFTCLVESCMFLGVFLRHRRLRLFATVLSQAIGQERKRLRHAHCGKNCVLHQRVLLGSEGDPASRLTEYPGDAVEREGEVWPLSGAPFGACQSGCCQHLCCCLKSPDLRCVVVLAPLPGVQQGRGATRDYASCKSRATCSGHQSWLALRHLPWLRPWFAGVPFAAVHFQQS